MSIAALPGRQAFVWGEVSGDVVAFDVEERKEIARVNVAGDSIPRVVVSADGTMIAATSQRVLVVLDAKTFAVKMRTIMSHAGFDLAFNETGTVVFAVGEGSVLEAFSTGSGDRLQSIPNTQVQSHAMAFDARHERLYLGGLGSGRITWYSSRLDAAALNPGPGGPLPTAMHVGTVCAVQKSVRRTRNWVVDVSEVQLFDNDSMRLLGTIPSDRLLAWGVVIGPHPRDADLFWYLQSEWAELRRVSTGEVVRAIAVKDADRLQTGAKSNTMVIKQSSGGWRVHDVDSGELVVDRSGLEGVFVEALSADGRIVQCTENVREGADAKPRVAVTLRDAMTGTLLRTLDARAGGYGVFSPDGKMFVPSGDRIRLYDVATGRLIRECESSDHAGWFMVFTPDGDRIISLAPSAMMTVWDVATGRRVAQLPVPGLISMHADGTLAVLGSDRILRFVRPTGDVNDPEAAPTSGAGAAVRVQQ